MTDRKVVHKVEWEIRPEYVVGILALAYLALKFGDDFLASTAVPASNDTDSGKVDIPLDNPGGLYESE